MARRKSGSSFLFVLLLFLLIGLGGGYLLFFTDILSTPTQKPQEKEAAPDDQIFSEVEEWVPEVVWSKPTKATTQVYYGTVGGFERTGTIVKREGYIDHFENKELLKKLGFKEDLNLSADGPGSSLWGYVKNIDDQMQIVVLSYENKDMVEGESGILEANCPCTLDLSVFVSDIFKPNWKESE